MPSVDLSSDIREATRSGTATRPSRAVGLNGISLCKSVSMNAAAAMIAAVVKIGCSASVNARFGKGSGLVRQSLGRGRIKPCGNAGNARQFCRQNGREGRAEDGAQVAYTGRAAMMLPGRTK